MLFGEGEIEIQTVQDLLVQVGLPLDAPLTTLAVELFRNFANAQAAPDPLGFDLGFERILRVSPLAPVPDAC